MIRRTYKRKLKLTNAQEKRLFQWLGATRLVYNMALDIRQQHYKAFGTMPSAYDLHKQLTDIRADIDWMADIPVHTMQAAID